MRRALGTAAPLLASLAMLGCGNEGSTYSPEGSRAEELVGAYCFYGAVNVPQLRGCVAHASPSEIARLDANAAEYARGELDDCLTDVGPFCRERLAGPIAGSPPTSRSEAALAMSLQRADGLYRNATEAR
jgi:hypothetical protein